MPSKIKTLIWAEWIEIKRSKWFWIYFVVFGGTVGLLGTSGLMESQVMGTARLTRTLITYIQLAIAILPLLVLISTVRSVASERETGVLGYMLSLPTSLRSYLGAKFIARFISIFLPVASAFLLAVVWGVAKGAAVPWLEVGYFGVLLAALSFFFLGLGFFVSALVKRSEFSMGLGFLIWLALILMLDVGLMGLLVQARVDENIIISIALANPMQVFRTGAIMLYDPELASLGPASYLILDRFGRLGFMLFGFIYPLIIGTLLSITAYKIFKRGDWV